MIESEEKETDESYKVNDQVEYYVVQKGVKTTGTIVEILTQETVAGSRHAHIFATENSPVYLIRNHHTGKESPYKLDHIIRRV